LCARCFDAVAAIATDALAGARAASGRPAKPVGARAAATTGARPEEVSFVVQGPVERDGPAWTARTCAALRAFFPGAEIVLSTWAGTDPGGVEHDEVVLSEDPGPVGTNGSNQNVNRQLVSTLAGIRAASRPLVVKVRSDLQFHDATLLEHWGRWPERGADWRVFEERVLMPNVFARRPTYLAPLALHPSDWSCMGTRADLELLFGVPPMTADQAHGRPPATDIGRWWGNNPERLGVTPEQYIWTQLLRRVKPELTLEHVWDLSPALFAATEQSLANNVAILDTYVQYGVSGPKYPYAGRSDADATLYQHHHWLELYEVHARGERDPDAAATVLDRLGAGDWRVSPADLAALRRGGAAWEANLLEVMLRAPTLVRDPTIGADETTTLMAAAMARAELRARLASR
jgi:hypothetical protein